MSITMPSVPSCLSSLKSHEVQSAIPQSGARGATFIHDKRSVRLGGKSIKKRSIIASCISGSGDTIGTVAKNMFSVYTFDGASDPIPRCEGVFDKETYKYGQSKPHMKPQPSTKYSVKDGIFCAAISDDCLALGRGSSVMVFSLSENGRCVFQHDENSPGAPNWLVSKLLFDTDGYILTSIFTNSRLNMERARVYSITQKARRSLSESGTTVVDTEPGSRVDWPIHIVVTTDGGHSEVCEVPTNNAAISPSATKIALCSKHAKGYAVIRVLVKDGSWAFLGQQKVAVHGPHDWSLQGFTGITLYPITNCRANEP